MPASDSSLRTLFLEALDIEDPDQRAAYLDRVCGSNSELRHQLEELLASNEEVSGILTDALGEHVMETPDRRATPLERIGRYKLLEKIGEGGGGAVYMAEQQEPVRRRVALKIIKPGLETRDVIARFEAERQALALMDHPNIARLLDAGTTGDGRVASTGAASDRATLDLGADRPYFVMELVPGLRLTDYCDRQKLDVCERLKLFEQVCLAVQHAHQKGIIHRDLKPSNILVTLQDGVGVPKIIDFGIAKATEQKLTDKTFFTRFAQFIGTPAYMSPEQAALSTMDVDTRSDIYSLGVLLYELLTGHLPFDTRELLQIGLDELCRTLREVEPLRPSNRLSTLAPADGVTIALARGASALELRSQLRGDLDWIVMKALEKDRSRRYETARDLALDLRRHLADEPVLAHAPTARYRFGKFARRNKLALSVTGLIAIVLVVATGVSLRQAKLARTAEAAALAAKGEADTKAKAERAARAEAESITSFLIGTFKSPHPKRDGRTITVAEILDRAISNLETNLASQPLRKARLKATLGMTYHALGLPHQAVPLQEAARDFFRTNSGPEHPDTLSAMGNLANSYYSAGRRDDSVRLFEELLSAHRKVLGDEHPDTLTTMNNLANSYPQGSNRTEVLKLRERVWELRLKVSGREHPDTLLAMGNLALSYKATGRGNDAVELMEEELALRRKVSGSEHPDTLSAMNNLALEYGDLGRRDQGRSLMEEMLATSRKVMGPEHPDTLEGINNLALLYSEAGRRTEALQMREELLLLRRKVLGPEHPDTLGAMQNLASSYSDAGRWQEALTLREDSWPLFRKVLGPKNPLSLMAMGNLANSYSAAGRRREALQLREQALALTQEVNGPEHPDTLHAMSQLAYSFYSADRYDEAIKMQEILLAARRKFRGAEHPEILTTRFNLALYYAGAGRFQESLQIKEELLARMRKVFGPTHPSTLMAMNGVSISYRQVGRAEEAIQLGRTSLELYQRGVGPTHEKTLNVMSELAVSYRAAGRLDEAIALHEQTLRLKRQHLAAGHPSTIAALEGLADSYAASNRKPEAEALLREVAEWKARADANTPKTDP